MKNSSLRDFIFALHKPVLMATEKNSYLIWLVTMFPLSNRAIVLGPDEVQILHKDVINDLLE